MDKGRLFSGIIILTAFTVGEAILPETTGRSSSSCAYILTPADYMNATCPINDVIALKSFRVAAKPKEANCTEATVATLFAECCSSIDSNNDCSFDYTFDAYNLYTPACNGNNNCLRQSQVIDFYTSGCNQTHYERFSGNYMHMDFFCIAGPRILEMPSSCSATTLDTSSAGETLYIQSPGFSSTGIPSSLAGCTCSVETDSCSSNIDIYTVQIILYPKKDNNNTCTEQKQSLSIISSGGTAFEWDCIDSTVNIGSQTASGNYLVLNLTNAHNVDQGSFWLGFKASDGMGNVSINCPAKEQVNCADTTTSSTTLTTETTSTTSTQTTDADANTTTTTSTTQSNTTTTPSTTLATETTSTTSTQTTNADANITTTTSTTHSNTTTMPSTTTLMSTTVTSTMTSTIPFTTSTTAPPEIDCGGSPSISNGNTTLIDQANTTLGAIAVVTCEKNFAPDGLYVQCLHDGMWSSTTCIRTACDLPPNMANGEINPLNSSDTSFGTHANVSCDEDFAATKDSITCLATGQWEQTQCLPTGCGKLPPLDNGDYLLEMTGNQSIGAAARTVCEKDYSPNAKTITCLGTGQWERTECKTSVYKTGFIVVIILLALMFIGAVVLAIFLVKTYLKTKRDNVQKSDPEGSHAVTTSNKSINTLPPPNFSSKAIITDTKEESSKSTHPLIEGKKIDKLLALASVPKPKTQTSNTQTRISEQMAQTQTDERAVSPSSIHLETKDSSSQTKRKHKHRNPSVKENHTEEPTRDPIDFSVAPVEIDSTPTIPSQNTWDGDYTENPSRAQYCGSRDYTPGIRKGESQAIYYLTEKSQGQMPERKLKVKKKKKKRSKSAGPKHHSHSEHGEQHLRNGSLNKQELHNQLNAKQTIINGLH
ncbi:mucin-5AC-like [Mya arenaria]|uniref:mucin-5AC-like n=1 Tax=Mya arenaria TaxID=6604 RepID=UPI0022DFE70C|nr:mucin-5AC-like [Mya arenaria]XP_052807782.1 mucin-5AC-like [Mya arenaria]